MIPPTILLMVVWLANMAQEMLIVWIYSSFELISSNSVFLEDVSH